MTWLRDFWHSPQALHWAGSFAIQVSLLASLLVAAVWLAGQPAFALRSVQVLSQGASPSIRHVTEEEIRQSVQRTSHGTALTRPLMDLQQSLQAHPWVRQASVRRVWPNRLMVWIEEHDPVAIWADGRLINRYGELFAVDRAASLMGLRAGCRLATLSGPVGSHERVLDRAQRLEQLISQQGFSLERLDLSEQFSWKARLHGGPEVTLGRDTLPKPQEERVLGFAQHLAWLNQDLKRQAEITGRPIPRVIQADLRYASGFAFRTIPVAIGHDARDATHITSGPNCLLVTHEGRSTHDS